jgi:hypothetical protein
MGLLERAHDAAYRFPADFAGFTADVITSAGTIGRVHIAGKKNISFDLEVQASDEDAQWVRDQVASILGHRWSTNFAEGDGRFEHRTQEDGDPTGTLVHLQGDTMNSAYRVGEDEIREVHRTAGSQKFTIVVSGSVYTPQGRLPNHFSVYYWSVVSGQLLKADQYRDVYTEVAGIQLPAKRTITTADSNGLITRILNLSGHEVTK